MRLEIQMWQTPIYFAGPCAIIWSKWTKTVAQSFVFWRSFTICYVFFFKQACFCFSPSVVANYLVNTIKNQCSGQTSCCPKLVAEEGTDSVEAHTRESHHCQVTCGGDATPGLLMQVMLLTWVNAARRELSVVCPSASWCSWCGRWLWKGEGLCPSCGRCFPGMFLQLGFCPHGGFRGVLWRARELLSHFHPVLPFANFQGFVFKLQPRASVVVKSKDCRWLLNQQFNEGNTSHFG